MKKKIIIAAAALLLIGIFIPVPRTYDDGTKSYSAVAYKIVKWNRPFYKNLVFTQTEVYKFPNSLKSVDEIWEGMTIDPAVSTVAGTVVGVSENGSKIEVDESDGIIREGETFEISSDDCPSAELKENDAVKVEYVPDKGSVGKIVDVSKEDRTEKETTLVFEDSAVYFQSTRKCQKYIIPERVQLSYENDAGTVNEIFGRYEFRTDPYDNLPDYEITIGNHVSYYESSSGIVTDSSVKKVNEEQSFVLSEADRLKINALIQKYAAASDSTVPAETEKPATTVLNTKEYEPEDTVHYIRQSWDSSADYPQAVFIRSRAQYEELFDGSESYYGDSSGEYDKLEKKYGEEFFRDHALVVVLTGEGSGSHYYTDVDIDSDSNSINITRIVPAVSTCDMAAWAVICEVPADDPILGKDSGKTEVSFNTITESSSSPYSE